MRGLLLVIALLLLAGCGAQAPGSVDVAPVCQGAPALQVEGAKLCQWSADGLCGVCTLQGAVGLYEVDECQWAQTHDIQRGELAQSESDPLTDADLDLMDCLEIVDGNPGGEWRP